MTDKPAPPGFGPFALLIGVCLIALCPVLIGSDGLVRAEALGRLLDRGEYDGYKYSLYGPLAAAPLWFLGKAVGYPVVMVWLFNRFVLLAAVVGFSRVFRDLLPERELTRFLVLLCLGSMFPWHAMYFFAEMFHVACVGLGLALIATRRGWEAALGGLLVIWGTANVPATAVGLGLAAAVLCWHRRRLRYLLLPAGAAALILFENWLRRGAPLDGGYGTDAGNVTVLPYSGRPGFSYPLFFGVLSVLFSFGRGLVFFAPGLFARYPEESSRHTPCAVAPPSGAAEGDGTRSVPATSEAEAQIRLVYRLWMAVVVGLVLVYARWWSWYGGAVWGPRFFLFASLPASLVLARWTSRPGEHSLGANLFVLLAVALSCWVGANGVVYDVYDYALFWGNDFALEYLMWYVPECSVLWRPFVVPRPLRWFEYLHLAAFAVGFLYLAGPTAALAFRQLREKTVAAWRAFRDGPRWRL